MPTNPPVAPEKEVPMTPAPIGERRGGRRRRESRALLQAIITTQGRRVVNASPASSVRSGDSPQPSPSNLAARDDAFSHVQVAPKPPAEEASEQRMQCTSPFSFKKKSFSEEAEADSSSSPNPYNWQANLANTSGGASFAQKARAAELNAARARKAAQMQSIDDELPDLSGPVSLGTYKFTRRGRGKKYETHKLSELQAIQEQEGEGEEENKVTEPTSTSSPHPPPNPPPPPPPPTTTLSSLPLPEDNTHPSQAEPDDSINHLANPSLVRGASHQSIPPYYHGLDSAHCAAPFASAIRPIYTDRRSFQAPGLGNLSSVPALGQRSSQESSVLTIPNTSSSQIFGQGRPSFSLQDHSSAQRFGATVNLHRQNPLSAYRQACNPFPFPNQSLNQNSIASIDTVREGSQVAGQGHLSFPPLDRRPDTSEQNREPAKTSSSNTLNKIDRQSSRASGQADSPFSPQDFQRSTSESQGEVESEINNFLVTRAQSLQASSQVHFPVPPKEYSSPKSLPLSDTLPTATFNLETRQWDPDLPEANMPAQTPTNNFTRGEHSSQHSSRPSSSRMSQPSQDLRNPRAIVTTTKSGRPYTNPYMPIDPPPSTARQPVKESRSGRIDLDDQNDDPDTVQHQDKMRYVDQEEARYQALEQANYENTKGSLDDPFQDRPTRTQHYTHGPPSNYVEHAPQQAAYGQMRDFGHQPALATYASDPSASSFLSNTQQGVNAPNAGMFSYHGQLSAYEQQTVVNHPAQNPGAALQGQRSVYEQSLPTNPRASVRLPAVRGTVNQQKVLLQEPSLESLSLEECTDKDIRDQRRRQMQGGVQAASGRASHAVPIRDPAAYTGSGLTTRRNQEALRQNLDTVITSSQGSTASARTVMNDPHRDRQPPRRPSSTLTDTTVTGSTLRAQAPSYEAVTAQHPATTNMSSMKPRPGTSHLPGRAGGDESEHLYSQYGADSTFKDPINASADTGIMNQRGFRAPAIPPGFAYDAATITKNAGLPAAATGAGNLFMNEIAKGPPPKRNPQQRLEDAATWFRTDPRDLSFAAAFLPQETMNKMNPERYPLEDTGLRAVSELADDSQDDEAGDEVRRAATPRPIGHGRPAGFTTPPSNHGPRRAVPRSPFSTLANVTSLDDAEARAIADRKYLEDDAKAIDAMLAPVLCNLMEAMNGPYDHLNHYAPPPAYAIDHNPNNNHTFFDPQWFATAPPARVGRDPRREQGEYEDPTQRSAGRRGDQARGEDIRRDSGGRGGSGGHVWGRN